MSKAKKILKIIAIILFIIDAIVVVYYTFINKNTKYTFNPTLKVDNDYQFTLSNIKNEVIEDDIKKYSPEYEINIDANDPIKIEKDEALSYDNSETLEYPLYKNDNCLYVNLSLSSEHDIYVIFISSNSNAYKYNLRLKGEIINRLINYKDLPKGRYHIYILDNEDKYDTMQTITIQ